jgi:hypothetical protein
MTIATGMARRKKTAIQRQPRLPRFLLGDFFPARMRAKSFIQPSANRLTIQRRHPQP